jgi:Zn-dependent alcohol dehydrogenase
VPGRAPNGGISCCGARQNRADDTVAILGCGGVGLGAVAASNARGARRICIDMDDEKLVVARAAGGSDAINTAKESLHDRLQDLTGGRGPDVVISDRYTPNLSSRSRRSRVHRKSGVHRLCQVRSNVRRWPDSAKGTRRAKARRARRNARQPRSATT